MIEDMGYGGERLGYYAGMLAASFCAAQFTSSIPWGIVSDMYGRKSAILVSTQSCLYSIISSSICNDDWLLLQFGTLGAAIGMVVFGTAKTFGQGDDDTLLMHPRPSIEL